MGLINYFFGEELRQEYKRQQRFAGEFEKPSEARQAKHRMFFDIVIGHYVPTAIDIGGIVYGSVTGEITTMAVILLNAEVFRTICKDRAELTVENMQLKRERFLLSESLTQTLDDIVGEN